MPFLFVPYAYPAFLKYPQIDDFDILQQCGKGVKTKSQEVLDGNFYVWRSYRGITDGCELLPTPPQSEKG